MNFFKSVFSDDDPQPSDSAHTQLQNPNSDPNTSTWGFGGLIKTLATTSESVIESYRRDFEELESGLKNETAVIRQVASRAVKELPQSLEMGATVAQESLESVGQAIDDIGASVWKSTAQIISHGRDTLLSSSDHYGSDSSSNSNSTNRNKRFNPSSSNQGSDVKRYSRFEMQVRAIQCDVGTYCTEPEGSGEYDKWRLGFVLEEKSGEIEDLIKENGVIREIYREVVPSKIDDETFWFRYFYRVHKLTQADDARARLIKRVISGEEEEDLSWDFDDDDEEEDGSLSKGDSSKNFCENENLKAGTVERDENLEERDSEKVDNGESSCKNSDLSVVSSQPLLPEDEDLGWDEIEDIGSNDENSKGEAVGSTNKANLHKRLSVAEEEEDLNWDIEYDDEPVKP